MFKILGWIIKASLFAAAILILGNVLHIGGHTVSDQVKTSLSHAEQLAPTNTIDQVKTWTGDIADKAKRAADEFKKPARHSSASTPATAVQKASNKASSLNRKMASENTPIERPRKPIQHGKITQNDASTESILASERQELRTLIRELNDSTEKLTAN
jgi:hypothetical protein